MSHYNQHKQQLIKVIQGYEESYAEATESRRKQSQALEDLVE